MKRQHDDHQNILRELYQRAADRAVIWIDDGSERIVDELEVETRIRPGTGGCQLCREPLDGSQKFVRGVRRPRPSATLFGDGEPVCIDCVEWIRWLHHYAGSDPVSELRFTEGAVVLRTGTEELYQTTDAKLTGLPSAGVWFPVYTCRRIEVRESPERSFPRVSASSSSSRTSSSSRSHRVMRSQSLGTSRSTPSWRS